MLIMDKTLNKIAVYIMDTTRYMKIGHKKVMKPEYFKTLPAHRALAYYKKHVVGIPNAIRCECCGERVSVT